MPELNFKSTEQNGAQSPAQSARASFDLVGAVMRTGWFKDESQARYALLALAITLLLMAAYVLFRPHRQAGVMTPDEISKKQQFLPDGAMPRQQYGN